MIDTALPEWLTVARTARELKCSRSWVYRLQNDNKLGFRRHGSRRFVHRDNHLGEYRRQLDEAPPVLTVVDLQERFQCSYRAAQRRMAAIPGSYLRGNHRVVDLPDYQAYCAGSDAPVAEAS